MPMMNQCESCGAVGTSVEERESGLDLCDDCSDSEEMDALDDEGIAEEYSIGDDVGSVTMVLEAGEHQKTVSGNYAVTGVTSPDRVEPYGDGKFERLIAEREPGVYLPNTLIRGGTPVQRSETLLERVAEEMKAVADRVADDFDVVGIGKSHDSGVVVYIDTSGFDEKDPWFDGDEYVEGTPFKSATLMGFRSGWWEHKESDPTLPVPG